MSPLSNRLNIGEEAFAVVVADGEGGLGDLYAIPGGGGVPLQITFSRVDESYPALTSDGSVIAFIRGGLKSGTQPVVVLMNLLNGAERRVELPEGEAPVRVAWSVDQSRIFIRTSKGLYAVGAPPRTPDLAAVAAADSASADSALNAVLGDPAIAIAGTCRSGKGVCARSDTDETLLDSLGRDPVRWGPDSVAYVSGNLLEVLSLGGGHVREVRPSRELKGVRQPTYAAGPGRR
ncbi:MAG: hypothetical protein ABJC74_08925 [Gemmatimonadota bacterium]